MSQSTSVKNIKQKCHMSRKQCSNNVVQTSLWYKTG